MPIAKNGRHFRAVQEPPQNDSVIAQKGYGDTHVNLGTVQKKKKKIRDVDRHGWFWF